jgi:co-chaperonin GroES (HSP10)
MVNRSGIIPVGETVLVLPDDIEEKTAAGIIVATQQDLERQQLGQVDGVLIAVSDYAWDDEPDARAKVGDRVIFAKFAGMIRKGNDGLTYRLVNDNDIKAILVKGDSNE